MRSLALFGFTLCVCLFGSEARIYGRCEFARALANLGVPRNQIPTWTCIAQKESNFDTAARNWSSGDHGILQISQIYWCTEGGGPGKGCNTECWRFRDADIVNDVRCAQKVYNEHTRLSGDGFNAWTTYKYCRGDMSQWIQGCF
uniref:lysozyme n=1 Tax=Harmonia axyridis TaxID=115357 RepID=A0A0A7M3Y9_HARAX|nr:c-type lysozyme 4 [Harmonia axyridis]